MIKKRFVAFFCSAALLTTMVNATNISNFSDVQGHWAYNALSSALDDGYLSGTDEGKLNPDDSLTVAQMAVILNRVFETSNDDLTYKGVVHGSWYIDDANKAVSAGFLPYDGSLNMEDKVKRAQVFESVVNAFGIAEANPDISNITKFSDFGEMTLNQRRAAAILVKNGFLSGNNQGLLKPNAQMTRAEFVTLIYKILKSDFVNINSKFNLGDKQEHNYKNTEDVVQAGNNIQESDMQAQTVYNARESDVKAQTVYNAQESDTQAQTVYNAQESDAQPQTGDKARESKIQLFINAKDMSKIYGQKEYESVILSGSVPHLPKDEKEKINTKRFVINTTGSTVNFDDSVFVDTKVLVVGSGNKDVNLSGEKLDNIEITGSGRTIRLSKMSINSLVVSGTNNNIEIDETTTIKDLKIMVGGTLNSVKLNGTVKNMYVDGEYTSVLGSGKIENTFVRGSYSSIPRNMCDNFDDSGIDYGLNGVTLSINTPLVKAGESIRATVTINGVKKPIRATAQWYYEDEKDNAFFNGSFDITNGKSSTYVKDIEFTRNMKLWQNVKFVIEYKNSVTDQVEKTAIAGSVQIENYPMSYYLPDVNEVLAKVNPTYRASNKDYTQDEKTVFVNAKGYESDTKYLIWISRSAQMVNVFEGYKNNWRLIKEFPCATGKASSPTPIGVTKTTYKQTGWFTPDYTCRPVVRFYPNSGYAFHSRLYYPNSNKLKDPSIGFPVSAGCVRMLDDGIYWLYDNVPSGTTVVVY